MEYFVLTITTLLLAYSLYLAVATTLILFRDDQLSQFQRLTQLLIAWLAPIVGALVVLHFINDHSSDQIDNLWLPWPTGWITRSEPLGSKTIAATIMLGFLGQAAVGYVVLSIILFGWPTLAMVGPYHQVVGVVMPYNGRDFRQPVKLNAGVEVLVYIPRRMDVTTGDSVALIRPLRYPFKVVGYIVHEEEEEGGVGLEPQGT